MKLLTISEFLHYLLCVTADPCSVLCSLPDPAFKRGNASAIFGAGPSFGLNPAVPASEEVERFKSNRAAVVRRNSQRKAAQERPTVRRSKSDVGTSRRAIDRRRSRDLERIRKLSESTVPKVANGKLSPSISPNGSASPRSVSDNSVDGNSSTQTRIEENGVRYPLFVPVAGGLASPGRTRIAKPVSKRTPNKGQNQKPASSNRTDNSGQKHQTSNQFKAQNGTPGQQIIKTKRSGSTPDARSPTRSANQKQTGSPSQSPGTSRPRAGSSPRYLPKTATGESSTLPRVKYPAKKANNKETSKTENSQSVPNSTCVSPRHSYQQREITRTPSQSSVSSSPGKLSHVDSRDKMSKIPSLARTPSADKSESKIPSRNPPRSKIPSFSKGDSKLQKLKEPEPKRSQIPGVSRSDSNKGQARSRIPSSSSSTTGRPDSAKENKDPVNNDVPHKPTEGKSRIPSFSSGSKPSKIASRHEPATHTEREPAISPKEENVDSPAKGKHTGIPTSRIPSFGKGTIDKPAVNGPAATPQKAATPSSLPLVQESYESAGEIPKPSSASKIPSRFPKETEPQSPNAPESRIPQAALSRSESGSQKSKIPGFGPRSTQPESKTPANTGIPKPHVNGVSSPTTPEAPSPTENKSKFPLVSKLPSPTESKISHSKPLAPHSESQSSELRAPKKEKPADVEISSDEVQGDKEESPIEKYIRSEAQKVEKLLRDEKVVVEVRSDTKTPEETDSHLAKTEHNDVKKAAPKQEKPLAEKSVQEVKTTVETTKEKRVRKVEDNELTKEPADTLISDVLASYSPDSKSSIKENKSTTEQVIKPLEVKKPVESKPFEYESSLEKRSTDSQGTKAAPEQVDIQMNSSAKKDTPPEKATVDDIYFQTFGSFGKKESQPTKESPPGVRPMPPKRTDSLGSKDGKDMGLSKRAEKPETLEIDPSVSHATESSVTSEKPTIDTLGGYEQQSRRSKSRNRKIVSPDGESDKEFTALTKEGKKDIDKDKYGNTPYSKVDEKAAKAQRKTSKDKPKFVIESSLGKDFYEAKRDSVQDMDPRPDSLVIANKTVTPPPEAEEKEKITKVEAQALPKEEFEDIDLNSQKESMKEIYRSVDDLDGKAKCVGCGGKGKCVIS